MENTGNPSPTPDNSTMNGLSSALWDIIISSVFMPSVCGVNVAVKVMDSSGARVEGRVGRSSIMKSVFLFRVAIFPEVERMNWFLLEESFLFPEAERINAFPTDGDSFPSDISSMVSGLPPVFVIVKVIGSDVSPMTRLPKLWVSGEMVNSGKPRPVPVNSTMNGSSSALWDIIISSVLMPAVWGVNVAVKVRDSSGFRVVGRVGRSVIWKSAFLFPEAERINAFPTAG